MRRVPSVDPELTLYHGGGGAASSASSQADLGTISGGIQIVPPAGTRLVRYACLTIR